MNIFQIFCCFVSVFLNSVLTFLIVWKSPKSLGFYKYLMMFISIFEAVYSILDMVTEPIVHSYNGAFAVFRYNGDSIFDRNIGFLLVCIYCGFFGLSLSIFGVHFVYRYGAIEKNFHEKYLSGRKIAILFIVPFVFFIWWAGMCIFLLRYSDETDRYMEPSISKHYGYKIKDTSSMCVLYHPLDQNGISHPDWRVFGILGLFWFMIFSSMFCVFYFGFKCYFQIKNSLKATETVSHLTKNLQQQLFQALVIQTVIPLVFMYIPIGLLFIFPTTNMDIGIDTSFVGYTIAAYPAIDPIPNMLIIKSYRNAILEFLGFVTRRPVKKRYGSKVTSSSADKEKAYNIGSNTEGHT